MGIGLGTAIGLSTGAQALSALLGKQAADKERERAERASKKRRRFLRPARDMLSEYYDTLEEMPGQLRRAREARLSSRAQREYERLSRNLGRAGATSGSSIASREMRNLATALEKQRADEMLQEKQAVQGMRGGAMSLSQRLAGAMYPSAGQTFPHQMRESYIDPSGIASNAIAMSAIADGDSGYPSGSMYQNISPGEARELEYGRQTSLNQYY
jgi:hypothetical protein